MVFGNAFSTIEGMFYPNDLVFRMPGVVEEAVCLEVIDGKTIEVRYTGLVEEEKTVELIGVDVSQFGSDAKTLLEKLIKGKTVYLSYDWEGESDGKVKAYVWRYFPNLSGGYHLMVNAILLANGYAVIDTEEYITTKMSAMLYETSDTAMKNKYGELKRFASEKPLKYSELEKEMKDYLYKYYWKVEPVSEKPEEFTEAIGEPKEYQEGNWFVKVEYDALTNEKQIFLVLQNENEKSLTIRKTDQKRSVFVSWGDYLGDNNQVSYKFDEGNIITENWSLSAGGTSIFYSGNIPSFINKLIGSEKFIISVSAYGETSSTEVFNLNGLYHAIEPYKDDFGLDK